MDDCTMIIAHGKTKVDWKSVKLSDLLLTVRSFVDGALIER